MSGEAELLSAIYRDPDDLGARAVWGDWLTEHGDPRGELVALQLAGGPAARIAKLIAEHGERWAGAIGDSFSRGSWRFEHGTFAGGVLQGPVPPDFSDPAWAAVRWVSGNAALVLSIVEKMPNLRTIRGLNARVPLAGPWQDVDVFLRNAGELRNLDGLTGVRRLALHLDDVFDDDAWRAPVLERIEVLSLNGYQIAGFAARLADRGSMKTLELPVAGWHTQLTRESAPGPWTRFVAMPRGDAKVPVLLEVLDLLPDTLEELVVDGGPREVGPPFDTYVAAALAKFPPEIVRVPWRVESRRALAFAMKADVRPNIAAVWDVLAGFGQRYDQLQVSRTTQPLAGLATLEHFLASGARVGISGGDGELWIGRDRCSGALAGSIDERAAMIALIDTVRPAWITFDRSFRQYPNLHPFRDAPELGRLVAFRPEHARLIPDDFVQLRHAGYAIVALGDPLPLRAAMLRAALPFDLQARVFAALSPGPAPRPDPELPWEAWFGDERDGLSVEVTLETGAVRVTRYGDDYEELARGNLAGLDAMLASVRA